MNDPISPMHLRAWELLKTQFRPGQAARLLGFTARELAQAARELNPPKKPRTPLEKKVAFEKWQALKKEGYSGNQAARWLSVAPSWFSTIAPRVAEEGDAAFGIDIS